MYIKAKYPKVGREWYRQGVQGFGSTYGGNQVSDVQNTERLDELNTSHDGEFNGESQQTL